jgi:hypothetical protein
VRDETREVESFEAEHDSRRTLRVLLQPAIPFGNPSLPQERHQLKDAVYESSADDAGDTVETFALPVSTSYSVSFFKVHPIGHPVLRAVGKRWRFHKFSSDPEFPAVDAEPAVLSRLFFIHKTLYPAPDYWQDAIVIVSHIKPLSLLA